MFTAAKLKGGTGDDFFFLLLLVAFGFSLPDVAPEDSRGFLVASFLDFFLDFFFLLLLAAREGAALVVASSSSSAASAATEESIEVRLREASVGIIKFGCFFFVLPLENVNFTPGFPNNVSNETMFPSKGSDSRIELNNAE